VDKAGRRELSKRERETRAGVSRGKQFPELCKRHIGAKNLEDRGGKALHRSSSPFGNNHRDEEENDTKTIGAERRDMGKMKKRAWNVPKRNFP